MISGEKILRNLYDDLDEKQYQPAGIDLTLGKIAKLEHNGGTVYGLLKDVKVLPQQKELSTVNMQVGGMIKSVFVLDPGVPYIATTAEKIKIPKESGQIYLPRSSLLRAGIDVRTAFGDPDFNGHLSFLVLNHTDKMFVLEKGVRFAQLVNIRAEDIAEGYSGDYNED